MMTFPRFICSLVFTATCGLLLLFGTVSISEAKYYCLGFAVGFIANWIQGN